ncbi:MAG: hypothetical protein AB7S77_15550 [Desulfatirhabdiaceae bacterium]
MTDSNPLYQHTVSIHPNMLSRFSRLFQQGVLVQATVGCSVHAFLCHQIGIRPEYLENRIQTIFLDGKAIDAPEQSVIANGSMLALSAAMPGLVGATFRKGGKYATFRAGITDTSSKIGMHEETGCVTVRLFNFMAAEIGPLFLKRGIIVTGKDILNAISDLESTENAFRINGRPASSKSPVGTLNPHDNILLILSPE